MSVNAIVINITLDGQNYPEWAFCVETALRGYSLLFHFTDEPVVLKSDNTNAAAVKEPVVLKIDNTNAAAVKEWQINDRKVMAAMVNSVKQSVIMSLSMFKTAKAIWSSLKQRYVQDSGALLHSLMQQTHVIEQNDMSIDEYFSAFDRLMGSLTSMVPDCTDDECPAHKLIAKFLTCRFVMGGRQDFHSIRKRIVNAGL
ncbi:uncharacterized protein C2845_PM13G08260 [Panicum miliaceum]|uniref:Retrotransposon Copia-like N-terminal domain-containing protein n=1 Tax=Panicum miliaceum TaxID=4540 RepID=A0A3L6RGK9_PANMI|nr:uncharacterized protein C2845_PM13G08260 [Panicum miliaceum]